MPFDLSLQIYTFFVFLRTISMNYFFVKRIKVMFVPLFERGCLGLVCVSTRQVVWS